MVKKGLETLPVKERIETVDIEVRMEPRFYEHAASVIKQHEAGVTSRDFSADVTLVVETAAAEADALEEELGKISSGRIRTRRLQEA